MIHLSPTAARCVYDTRAKVSAMDSPKLRVVLADCYGVTHSRLREFLRVAGDIIVAEANGARQTLDVVTRHKPDVLVLEVQTSSQDEVELIRSLRSLGSQAGILALVDAEDPATIRAALRAGANGYALKSSCEEEIVEAVHAVHEANNVLIQGHLEWGH